MSQVFRVLSAAAVVAAAVLLLSAAAGAQAVKEVPDKLPRPDGKDADLSRPVQVFILMGQSNMVGLGNVGPEGKDGTLEHAVRTKGMYPYLIDDAGKWIERKDVRNVRVMVGKGGMQLFNNEWMTVTGKHLGPEFGIGHILGHAIEAPVLVLKSCIGNRSLGWDLLPPGSEPYENQGKTVPGYRGTPDNPKGDGRKPEGVWYAGKQYDDDVENAKKVLADLGKYYPGAKTYEVAGFFWWQGEKDTYNDKLFGGAHAARYERNLAHLIKQLRKDFDAPGAKFVLATLGEAKKGGGGNGGMVLEAQLAVDGASGKHPEFKGNVATVYSNPLSRGGSGNSHYNGNAETYMDVGEAMGRAMARLLAAGR